MESSPVENTSAQGAERLRPKQKTRLRSPKIILGNLRSHPHAIGSAIGSLSGAARPGRLAPQRPQGTTGLWVEGHRPLAACAGHVIVQTQLQGITIQVIDGS